MPVDQAKWHNLLTQTQDLVQLDHHGYPVVQRDLQGLLQSSQTARARTSRVRSAADQAAASRLLSNQGFDAGRLQQDVAMLELAPTVADVFAGDGATVDEYLAQIQEMSILTAIQEAQQDSILSFERQLDEATARDWAADKGRLLGAVAPYTGLGGGGGGGGGFGHLSFGSAAPRAGEPQGGRITAKEQAYVQVVKRINAAAARHEPVDAVAELGAACAANEDRPGASGATTAMSSVWALLGDILAPSRERGLAPGGPGGSADFLDSLVQGGRAHLSKLFARHVRNTISKHRAVAQRGGDPDKLRDIQAYLSVKFKDRGPLDFQQAGGQDTSWVQVYYALRCGHDDLALRAAAKATDAAAAVRPLGGGGGGGSLAPLLEAWLADPAGFRAKHGAAVLRECERLVQAGPKQPPSVRADYMLLVYSLLAGDARALDAATRRSPGLAPTIEDFLWLKLTAVRACGATGASGIGSASPGSAGSGAPAYRLSDLQAELNRWPAKYYSREGAEPLLYATVLLLSAQFRAALRFMATDDSAKGLRPDAVHVAIALHFAGVLDLRGEEPSSGPPLDVPELLRGYGQRFVRSDSEVALQYYMLAAAAGGGGIELKGRLLRELLVESKDYGTLLGAGGPLGTGGAIQAFVSGPEERCALLEAVAYDCQLSGRPDEARELFMAARRPRSALRIVNQQLSAAIHEAKGAMSPSVQVLIERGQAAVEAMGAAAADDAPSRREAEAFQQLCLTRRLLELTGGQQWDAALQVLAQLSFIPSERARVEACKSEARRLDDAVRQRLGDVIEAAAAALLGVRGRGDAGMLGLLRDRAECLKLFVLDLDPSVTPATFMHVNSCLRGL
ncbi:MAG: Nup93/Nic96-domain-containing protein [Monoraphidium minutum]|nr:MAG: Nup93/Nic96-domain-containing protein [Monoraphidium minutum]